MQAWGQPRPSSSASVPSPSPSSSPVDPVPDPVSTPSDPVPVRLTDPVPDDPSAPAPASVPSYPSITVDDHPRTKHVKRLELVTPEDGEVVVSSDHSVPLHHGVLVHEFLLPLIIRNLSVLSSQK